jgi:hypothetical protein
MLGRDRNNNVLFSIHPTVGHQQHCWRKGGPGPAEPASLGREEMGLERCGVEVRVSCRCAVLYLGLDIGSQARVRGLLKLSLSFPRFLWNRRFIRWYRMPLLVSNSLERML